MMALTSGLFKSVNGDRKYKADFFASYFASFIGNGVFPIPSTGLQVIESSAMQTVVKSGKGWINGYFVVNDNDYVLQHDIADGVLKRIDRVVLRLDFLEREISIAIKKGTPASSPTAPTLTRNLDYYELALADVLINNGATQITQANITDTRLNNELCGIVHGTVDQVDTTTLFNQYQSWFNQMQIEKVAEFDNWKMAEQADFEAWFATLENILDENVAVTLTAKIQALETGKADNNNLTQLQEQVNSHLAQNNEQAHQIVNIIGLQGELDKIKDKVDKSSVGQANGVAPLDSSYKLPYENLPIIQGTWELISSVNLNAVSVEFADLNFEEYKFLRLIGRELTKSGVSIGVASVGVKSLTSVNNENVDLAKDAATTISKSSTLLTANVPGRDNYNHTGALELNITNANDVLLFDGKASRRTSSATSYEGSRGSLTFVDGSHLGSINMSFGSNVTTGLVELWGVKR